MLREVRRELADHRLLCTNPVHCIDKLIRVLDGGDLGAHARKVLVVRSVLRVMRAHGVYPPRASQENLPPWARMSSPGGSSGSGGGAVVNGVLVDLNGCPGTGRCAYLVPIQVLPADSWFVSESLPFSALDIKRLLSEILAAAGLPHHRTLPERFAFRFEDGLGRDASGRSMDLIAALGVIQHFSQEQNDLLSSACSIVEPSGDDASTLRSVDHVSIKLGAFLRERGTGAVLIHHPDDVACLPFLSRFEEAWPVRDLRELANHLERVGLLGRFLGQMPFTTLELRRQILYVEDLVEGEHRYLAALDSVRRTMTCGLRKNVPQRYHEHLEYLVCDLHRCLGQVSAALLSVSETLSQGPPSERDDEDYVEQIDEDVRAAGALALAHRYNEALEYLVPWEHRLREDERLVPEPQVVQIFNAMAAVRITLGQPGWEDLLLRSIRILSGEDPAREPRARLQHARGCLATGRLADARCALDDLAVHPELRGLDRWFHGYLRAELARRERDRWMDPSLDDLRLHAGVLSYPLGYYHVAVSRQPGQRPSEVLSRLTRARSCFLNGLSTADGTSLFEFPACITELLHAGYQKDKCAWGLALERALGIVRSRGFGGVRDRYAELLARLQSQPPSFAGAELLYESVPVVYETW